MLLDFFRSTDVEETRSDLPVPQALVDLGVTTGWTDEKGALSIPAFWRAVRLKTDTISTLPLMAYDGTEKLAEQPVILTQPDPTEDVIVTLSRLVSSLILRGNAFALLGSFDELGYPRSLKVISTDAVSYEKRDDGTYAYRVNGELVPDEQILHIRGFTLAGEPFGLGCVEMCRRALAGAISMEEYAGRFYSDNGTPSAVIKNSGSDLSPEEAELLKSKWMAAQRGKREPVVLNKDLDFEPVMMTNQDAQFLQQKKFSLTDIANIVGVPGHFIGAETGSMTYSNIGQEGLNLTKLYLRHEIIAVERAFSALMPEGFVAKFDMDDIHRADTKERYETYQIGLNAGIIHKDEIRAEEGRPPLGETIDTESMDPNVINAVVNAVKAGFDPEALLKALKLPPIPFTAPEEPDV